MQKAALKMRPATNIGVSQPYLFITLWMTGTLIIETEGVVASKKPKVAPPIP